MPTVTDLILPAIGSSGVFSLRTPFDALLAQNERCVCKAIRKLSDYLANNEDPKALIYTANHLPDAEYDEDLAVDMYIISLQSTIGHWIYLPARYLISYPIVNGIPYRTSMIGVSLPSLPADRDLSFLTTAIGNLVTDSLGVTPVIKVVETSRVVLVDKGVADTIQVGREILIQGKVTDRARYISAIAERQTMLDKIAALETYILAHRVQLGI